MQTIHHTEAEIFELWRIQTALRELKNLQNLHPYVLQDNKEFTILMNSLNNQIEFPKSIYARELLNQGVLVPAGTLYLSKEKRGVITEVLSFSGNSIVVKVEYDNHGGYDHIRLKDLIELKAFSLTFTNCEGAEDKAIKWFKCDGEAEEFVDNAIQSMEDKYGMLNWECHIENLSTDDL